MEYTIRPATAADHEGIARIAVEVAAMHAEALPGTFRAASDPLPLDQLLAFLQSDTHHVIVAEAGHQVVGFARLLVRQSPDHPVVVPRTLAWIDEIGVLASARGRGIGRLLMDAAARWARERGASALELSVHEFNDRAIDFYGRLGFSTIGRRMALPLGATNADDGGG